MPLAVSALEGRLPAGAAVVVPGPLDPALVQYDRLRAGPNSRPAFGPYRIIRRLGAPPAYLIISNRSGRDEPWSVEVAEGRARELWRAVMPPGDPACRLMEYFGPSGLGAGPAPR